MVGDDVGRKSHKGREGKGDREDRDERERSGRRETTRPNVPKALKEPTLDYLI